MTGDYDGDGKTDFVVFRPSSSTWYFKLSGGATGTFAYGLQKDISAVNAAVDTSWSNGQVEGQVNRLKTLKRQMYGRAGFERVGIYAQRRAEGDRDFLEMRLKA